MDITVLESPLNSVISLLTHLFLHGILLRYIQKFSEHVLKPFLFSRGTQLLHYHDGKVFVKKKKKDQPQLGLVLV